MKHSDLRQKLPALQTLRFRLPDGWSVVTEYKDEGGRMAVTSRDRSLTLPTGWEPHWTFAGIAGAFIDIAIILFWLAVIVAVNAQLLRHAEL